MAVVDDYNRDPGVDAFLMQYPFPPGLDYAAAMLAMDPDKDVDGLHPVSLGNLVIGVPGPRPCTPAGIQALLQHYEIPIAGQHVVIVGRGLTIGRPLANLLSLKEPGANAAVTVIHTGVADLGAYTRQADILVAAAGSPGIITPDMVKPGAVVVAAGVTFEEGRIRSDVAARGARGRRLDVAAGGRGRAHDPGHAAAQHGRGRRAPRRLTSLSDGQDQRSARRGPDLLVRVLPAQDRRRGPQPGEDHRRAGAAGPLVRVGDLRGGRLDP